MTDLKFIFTNKTMFSIGEFVNLKNYAMRMKETFWPDWDRCLAELRT